jgi:ASC-1-like (ASCH) protein
MKLQPESFGKIKNGSKTIELRLFDEKRQMINIGDVIEFQKEPDKTEIAETEVVALLRYHCFKDLIDDFPLECFDDDNKEILIEKVHEFYSEEEEQKYGVLGIKIQLI